MILVNDSVTGLIEEKLVPLKVATEMTITGLDKYETKKRESCVVEPIYGFKGEKIGEKTVCNLNNSNSWNCELVPVIDSQSGEVIDLKQVCKDNADDTLPP